MSSKQAKSQLFLKVFSTRLLHAVANLQSNADLNPFNYIYYYVLSVLNNTAQKISAETHNYIIKWLSETR